MLWTRQGITGNSLKNVLLSLGGNDKVTGSSGDDIIFGGDGDDTITGSEGNDVLVGGEGSDRIIGSSGADVLIAGKFGSETADEIWGDVAWLRDLSSYWVAKHAEDERTEDAADEVIDTVIDQLTGGDGADLFIISLGDKITDYNVKKDGDVIEYT